MERGGVFESRRSCLPDVTWLDLLNGVLKIQVKQNSNNSKHTRRVKTTTALKHA